MKNKNNPQSLGLTEIHFLKPVGLYFDTSPFLDIYCPSRTVILKLLTGSDTT